MYPVPPYFILSLRPTSRIRVGGLGRVILTVGPPEVNAGVAEYQQPFVALLYGDGYAESAAAWDHDGYFDNGRNVPPLWAGLSSDLLLDGYLYRDGLRNRVQVLSNECRDGYTSFSHGLTDYLPPLLRLSPVNLRRCKGQERIWSR